MVAIISFLFILLSTLLIVRTGAVMLRLTGMSYDVARFQARSAFTGTGFTTAESEMIINHPVRRRIIAMLMVTGNIGFISFVSSLVITFLGADQNAENGAYQMLIRIAIMFFGLIMLYLLSRSKLVDRVLQVIIERSLKRWTKLNVQDYESLLNLSGEFNVIQYQVQEDSWIANRSLEGLQLINEGVLVLGIKRFDGYYVGAPQSETLIYSGDEVVIYGREAVIRSLTLRKSGPEGDMEHKDSVKRQKMVTNKKVQPGESK